MSIKGEDVLLAHLSFYLGVNGGHPVKSVEDKNFAMLKETILFVAFLQAILGDPQGAAYLPPTGNSPARPGAGHPDEWAGDPANYEFSYEVQDAASGLDFGHREMRKDDEATGSYHVLLPDGRTQIVDYVADGGGYRPMVRYEGTASFPAPASGGPGGSGEGYRY